MTCGADNWVVNKADRWRRVNRQRWTTGKYTLGDRVTNEGIKLQMGIKNRWVTKITRVEPVRKAEERKSTETVER